MLNISVLISWTTWNIGSNGVTSVRVALNDSIGTLLPYDTLYNIQFCDTECSSVPGVVCYAETKNSFGIDNVNVFIGDGCSSVCEPCSALAAADNTAIISFDCNLETLSNRTANPTFTRAVSPYPHRLFSHFMKFYNWDRVALFIEDIILWVTTGVKVKEDLEANGIKVHTFMWSTVLISLEDGIIDSNNLQTLRSAIKLAQDLARGMNLKLMMFFVHYLHS